MIGIYCSHGSWLGFGGRFGSCGVGELRSRCTCRVGLCAGLEFGNLLVYVLVMFELPPNVKG